MFERIVQCLTGTKPEAKPEGFSLFDAYDALQAEAAAAERLEAERNANAPIDQMGRDYDAIAALARGPLGIREPNLFFHPPCVGHSWCEVR